MSETSWNKQIKTVTRLSPASWMCGFILEQAVKSLTESAPGARSPHTLEDLQLQLKRLKLSVDKCVYFLSMWSFFCLCGVHCPAGSLWPTTSGHCCVKESSAASCHFNLLLCWYFLLKRRTHGAFCFHNLEQLTLLETSVSLWSSGALQYRSSSTSELCCLNLHRQICIKDLYVCLTWTKPLARCWGDLRDDKDGKELN